MLREVFIGRNCNLYQTVCMECIGVSGGYVGSSFKFFSRELLRLPSLSHSLIAMIRFILLQNRQGKTRLAKYYVPLEESEKHKVEYEVHRLVVNRDPKFTNFVEFRTHKVIYRRYAGLFFSMCVDITDNELAYLECIHLFVEILDHFFSNVCELDLVFNFHKVYLILDEFILAGELQETSKKAIIERMGELEKQDKLVMYDFFMVLRYLLVDLGVVLHHKYASFLPFPFFPISE
ncbi:AP-2 complex subunit sigma [Asimina triloba]